MKNKPFDLGQLSKPKAAPAKKAASARPHIARAAAAAKPTAWGLGVLKKIEQFRMALALEK